MTAPQMVGSIINAQWLARQMGLPVEEVTARIEQARKEDQWPGSRLTTISTSTQRW